MLRFVLLYHDCPPGYERASHWDLMLESGQKLSTWALARLPRGWEAAQLHTARLFPACATVAAESEVAVERLPEHRLDYLHEEGPLTNNRGTVRRIDAGTYEAISKDSQSSTVVLNGSVMSGQVTVSDSILNLH